MYKTQVLFFSFLLLSFNTKAQTINIEGRIVDSSTLLGIPFANIGLPELGIGTSANENGAFIIKLAETRLKDTLVVSSMGYKTLKIPVPQALNKKMLILKLKSATLDLREIVITSLDGKAIIKKVLEKRTQNYATDPVLMEGFYREMAKQKDTTLYFNYSEGILEMYKSSVKKNSDEVRLIKGRKKKRILHILRDTTRYTMPNITNGPHLGITLDIIKTEDGFLENYKHYNFHHEGYEIINDQLAFVIHFKPLDNEDGEIFTGKVYVDTASFAIVKAVYYYSPFGINTYNVGSGYLDLINRKFELDYTQFEGKWYIHKCMVTNEFYHKYALSPIFNTMLLNITKITKEKVKRFKSSEIISYQSALNEHIMTNDDDSFWEDYNFIKSSEIKPTKKE